MQADDEEPTAFVGGTLEDGEADGPSPGEGVAEGGQAASDPGLMVAAIATAAAAMLLLGAALLTAMWPVLVERLRPVDHLNSSSRGRRSFATHPGGRPQEKHDAHVRVLYL